MNSRQLQSIIMNKQFQEQHFGELADQIIDELELEHTERETLLGTITRYIALPEPLYKNRAG